jgi:hypothetical protein
MSRILFSVVIALALVVGCKKIGSEPPPLVVGGDVGLVEAAAPVVDAVEPATPDADAPAVEPAPAATDAATAAPAEPASDVPAEPAKE